MNTGSISTPVRIWTLSSLAVLALVSTAWATAAFWPITFLGHRVDRDTGVVFAVDPESPAAQAGVRVDDRIVAIYGLPYADVVTHWNILRIVGPRDMPIPVVVERDGNLITLSMERSLPPASFQATKLVGALLAFICVLTGWLLGVVRRHEVGAAPLVALFWIMLGGLAGIYQFARFASPPLLAIIQCVFIIVLAPLGMYIHLLFPPRPVALTVARRARLLLITAWLMLALLFIGVVVIVRPPLVEFVVATARILPLAFCVAFVGSGIVLARAYRRTIITHVRRQIRLIASACLFVGMVWLVLLALPLAGGNLPLIADAWLDLLTALIPLAYLIGGVLPNLYHLDRVVRRGGAGMATISIMILALSMLAAVLPPGWPLVVGIVTASVLLAPHAARIGARIFASRERSYAPLHAAAHALTTTLDPAALTQILASALRDTFHQPRLGIYLADPAVPHAVQLAWRADAPELPEHIEPGVLVPTLATQPTLCEARSVHTALRHANLHAAELAVLHAPDQALWGVLRHASGDLLGFFVLGADRSLEPYRAADRHELQRLIAAATLAFAHSAAYEEQRRATACIRDLYHEVQRTRDATTSMLARELHDEIIHVYVRPNLHRLRTLRKQSSDPAVHAELTTMLKREEDLAEALRKICERIHPSGLDDPLGLPTLLRIHAIRAETMWPGTCTFQISGDLHPIAIDQQAEIVRILRESINNAVQHADATRICLTLRYPQHPAEPLQLTIEDNGCSGKVARPRPGQRGIYGMYASADAIGGHLTFEPRKNGGTRVRLRVVVRAPASGSFDNTVAWTQQESLA